MRVILSKGIKKKKNLWYKIKVRKRQDIHRLIFIFTMGWKLWDALEQTISNSSPLLNVHTIPLNGWKCKTYLPNDLHHKDDHFRWTFVQQDFLKKLFKNVQPTSVFRHFFPSLFSTQVLGFYTQTHCWALKWFYYLMQKLSWTRCSSCLPGHIQRGCCITHASIIYNACPLNICSSVSSFFGVFYPPS